MMFYRLTKHAQKRLKRCKGLNLAEAVLDAKEAAFLHRVQDTDKCIYKGLRARYVVKDDGLIITILPLVNRRKARQKKIKRSAWKNSNVRSATAEKWQGR